MAFKPYSEQFDISFLTDLISVGSNGLAGLLNDIQSDEIEYTVFPGFADVHVHLREPGFSYKETVATGTAAAAHGGYTAICAMPNLSPVPDCVQNLRTQLDIIGRDAVIDVIPYGAITVGERGTELADVEALAPHIVAFSDDGKGVQSEEMMRLAMTRCKSLGKLIAAHCEDESLLRGGYIHDGVYCRTHGHRGICSESEWRPIERDLRLAEETGCAYHVCHVSTKESVALIRDAKKRGVNVTCETAPHYLLLDDSDLQEDGAFKMNPPLRDTADRAALIEGILDGTVDMIATDHAPHSAEEKSRGLEKSPFGITGIELAFPLLYTELVEKGIITMDRLVELLCCNPRRRFELPLGQSFSVWNLDSEWTISKEKLLSMGKSTPFAGKTVKGECILTVCDGKISYVKNKF